MLLKLSNSLVNFFLLILAIVSVIGAIGTIPSDVNDLTKFGFWGMVFLIFIIYFFLKVPNLRKSFWKSKRIFLTLISIMTMLWQAVLLVTLSGDEWWDPGIIARAAAGEKQWLGLTYFSYYPNTFYLFRLEKFLFDFLNLNNFQELTIVLNCLNLIILDISFLLLLSGVKRLFHNKKITYLVVFFTWTLVILSPYIVIFYSDILGLLCSTLYIYILSFFFSSISKVKESILTMFLAILGVISYFIKPSLVIAYIAMAIVILIYTAIYHEHMKKLIGLCCLFLLTGGIVFSGFNYYEHNNSIYSVDASKAMPMSHFMAMGMAGKGGYDFKNAQENFKIKDSQARNEKNLNVIRNKLKSFGITNYLKFLFMKQIYNTSDATFGWKNEANGIGFLIPFKGDKNFIYKKVQSVFTSQYSNYSWKGYATLNQIIWVVVLSGLIFSLGLSEKLKVQYFKYVVIGGMIFLLLFEGGRSRYIIQFLPYIFTLSSLGIVNILENLKELNLKLLKNKQIFKQIQL